MPCLEANLGLGYVKKKNQSYTSVFDMESTLGYKLQMPKTSVTAWVFEIQDPYLSWVHFCHQ